MEVKTWGDLNVKGAGVGAFVAALQREMNRVKFDIKADMNRAILFGGGFSRQRGPVVRVEKDRLLVQHLLEELTRQ